MENIFVPYYLSMALKSKGFNKPCMARYEKTESGGFKLEIWNVENHSNCQYLCAAPIYQQVFDWLELKHNIYIECPNYYKNTKGYKPEYEVRINGKQLAFERPRGGPGGADGSVLLFNIKREAYNEAIEEALNLIK